jgi:hypothetical protein
MTMTTPKTSEAILHETPKHFSFFQKKKRLHGCTIAAMFSGDGTVRICFSVRNVPSSMECAHGRTARSHHTTPLIMSKSGTIGTHTRNSHRFTTRRGGAFKR